MFSLWLVIIAYSFWIGSILPVIYILPNYYGKIQFFVNNSTFAPFDKKDHRESTYSVKLILSLLFILGHAIPFRTSYVSNYPIL